MLVSILLCTLPLALPVLASLVASLLPCAVLLTDPEYTAPDADYPVIYAPDPRPVIGALPRHPWGASDGLRIPGIRTEVRAYPMPEIRAPRGADGAFRTVRYSHDPRNLRPLSRNRSVLP